MARRPRSQKNPVASLRRHQCPLARPSPSAVHVSSPGHLHRAAARNAFRNSRPDLALNCSLTTTFTPRFASSLSSALLSSSISPSSRLISRGYDHRASRTKPRSRPICFIEEMVPRHEFGRPSLEFNLAAPELISDPNLLLKNPVERQLREYSGATITSAKSVLLTRHGRYAVRGKSFRRRPVCAMPDSTAMLKHSSPGRPSSRRDQLSRQDMCAMP